MPDTLHIVPHPEEQRTYAELRTEFRADNLERIRSEFAGQHPVGWNMIGDPTTARDGYSASQWRDEMLKRMDEPVIQDFGLSEVPLSVWIKMADQAVNAEYHDSVTWEEGEDQDASPCDLSSMSEDEICDYVDREIRESARG